MIKLKQNVAKTIHVRLIDPATFQPVVGVLRAAATAAVSKAGAAASAIALDGVTNDWVEETTGAFSGQGVYRLTLGAANMDTIGTITVACAGGSGRCVMLMQVVSALEADMANAADQAAIKGKTDALPASPASEDSVTARPTLAQIEASAVLAKDGTVAKEATLTAIKGAFQAGDDLHSIRAAIPAAPDNARILAIDNRLPANPASRQDVESVGADVDALATALADLDSVVFRIAGLCGANQIRETLTRDAKGRPLTGRIRTYDSEAAMNAKDAAHLVATYPVSFTWNVDGTVEMKQGEEVAP